MGAEHLGATGCGHVDLLAACLLAGVEGAPSRKIRAIPSGCWKLHGLAVWRCLPPASRHESPPETPQNSFSWYSALHSAMQPRLLPPLNHHHQNILP
jgi:hypothetical protein